MTQSPRLFEPLTLRGVTVANRIVISPMCQYSAEDGALTDWHLVHLGSYAKGGAGLVFVEASAVTEQGRITHGDSGLWHDRQIAPLKRVVDFIHGQGAKAALQLAHAGRKASTQRPWFGNGPLGDDDFARGDLAWQNVAPSPIPVDDGWLVPHELTTGEISGLVEAFAAAARRAIAAGIDVVEVHGAHGYLLQSFLSPISNARNDAYGGDLAGRMRFPLEVAEAVRGAWPEDKPLFFRVSSVDGFAEGWRIEDTVTLARELKALGVDVIDCSSGGIKGSATAVKAKRQPGFQVPFAERVRREVGIATQAVGLITHPRQAEAIIEAGQADLIAIGREALYDPFWARHAAMALGADPEYDHWPEQYGWWLVRRARTSDFYDATEAKTAAE